LWEKGVRGMRGKSAQGCRKPLITPKNSTFERLKPSAMQGEALLRGLMEIENLIRCAACRRAEALG
jgi:hypothetical protein